MPLVAVCAASSPLRKIIVSPTRAVAYEGTKQRFVTSHPCSDEPRAFSILISSANALSEPIAVNARDMEKINSLFSNLSSLTLFLV